MNSITVGVLFGKFLDHSKENPFPNPKRSEDYILLTEIGLKKGFRVVIGSIRNVKGKLLKEAHEYINGWKKVNEVFLDVVLDRSFTSPKTIDLKYEIGKKLPILNNPDLNLICWDKLSYKDIVPEHVPLTLVVNSKKELDEVVKKIPTNTIVLKPRFGIMGNNVEIVAKNNLPSEVEVNTLVQEFVDTSNGIPSLGIKGVHDIRVVLINHKIHHCYIRYSKGPTSNITQGGFVKHIKVEDIPKDIIFIVKKLVSKLKKYGKSLYTVDCALTSSDEWILMELESIPGLRMAYKIGNEFKMQNRFLEDIFDVLASMIR
jgi:glutathione synthase/RimK-type ligase-like ATP-grasp enzyme